MAVKFLQNRGFEIIVVVFLIVIILFSVLIPLFALFYLNADFKTEVNSTVINGILTSTAIIFGFVTFELRDIQISIKKKFSLTLPLLIFLMTTVVIYYVDILRYGNTTNLTLVVAVSNFLFNLLYSTLVIGLKDVYSMKVKH